MEMNQMERSRFGGLWERTNNIISVVRDLTDSLLVYFPTAITVAFACQ